MHDRFNPKFYSPGQSLNPFGNKNSWFKDKNQNSSDKLKPEDIIKVGTD